MEKVKVVIAKLAHNHFDARIPRTPCLGSGPTLEEALGKLVSSYPDFFNVIVELREDPDLTR